MAARYELSSLDDDRSSVWHDGYGWGFVHGIDRGRVLAEEEMADAWWPVVAHVRKVAKNRTHEELQRLRADFSTARPVPTYQECEASWAFLLEGQVAA